MKKLLAVISAVCLSLFVGLMLVACDGKRAEEAKYYAYDVDSGEYDTDNYLEIRGKSCSMVSESDGMTVSIKGTIEYSGKNFVVRISYADDTEYVIILKGEKEGFGVLRVDSETLTMNGVGETLYEVSYFCNKGCAPKTQGKPDNPIAGGEVYYEYDPTTESYSDTGYITVDGNTCVYSGKYDELGIDFDANGTIVFVDDEFVIDCTGYVIVAEMRIILTGVKEKDGVLRVNGTTMTVMGTTESDSYTYYLCMDGKKPDNPVID